MYEPSSRLSSLISPFSSVVYSFSKLPPTFLNLNTAFASGFIVWLSSFTSLIYGFWSFKNTSNALSPLSFVISIDCGVEFTICSLSVAISRTVYVPGFKSYRCISPFLSVSYVPMSVASRYTSNFVSAIGFCVRLSYFLIVRLGFRVFVNTSTGSSSVAGLYGFMCMPCFVLSRMYPSGAAVSCTS